MTKILVATATAVLLAGGATWAAQLGGAAGGAAALSRSRGGGKLTYRVIDGEFAKRIDRYCATLWLDTDEVLMIEYRSRTYMMRTGFGDIGRACRID